MDQKMNRYPLALKLILVALFSSRAGITIRMSLEDRFISLQLYLAG